MGTMKEKDMAKLGRRDRRGRVTAGLVGLALTTGAIGLSVVAFRGGDTSGPASAPVPGPTSSPGLWTGPGPEPILDIEFDDVYRSEDPYLIGLDMPVLQSSQVANHLMGMADLQFETRPMIVVGPATSGTEVTSILCLPDMQDEAEQLREKVFPGAEISVGKPKYDDIAVKLGNDFLRRHRFELDAASHIGEFLDLRMKGHGAEPYISEDVAARYEGGEEGLSLYRYATLSAMYLEVMQLRRNDDVVEIAVVPIWGETAYMDDDGPLVEILQVGWVADPTADGGRRLTIVGVYRDTFPFPEA